MKKTQLGIQIFGIPIKANLYLALVGELGGGDVQLLVLILELGEVRLQPGLVQLGAVQQGLQALMVRLELLVVLHQLTVGLVQPGVL